MKKVEDKSKKSFSLKREYKLCFNYIRQSSKFIWFVIAFFIIFALLSFFLPVPQQISDEILKFIQRILEQTKGLSQIQMIKFIFFNNLISSFIGIVLGIFFGIFPILSAIANGYILGFVGSLSVKEEGFLSLLRILPHGIFELPAVFISFGLGVKLGTFIFSSDKWKTFKLYFENSMRVFILIVIPLLIIAAIIEGSLIFILG